MGETELMRWKFFRGKILSQGGRTCHDSFESYREFARINKSRALCTRRHSAAEGKKSVGCVDHKQRGGRRTLVSAAAARLSTHAGRAREKSGGSGETLIQWVSY